MTKTHKLVYATPDQISYTEANTREDFDLESMKGSIDKNMLIHPPTAKKDGSGFRIVAGERRTRAMIEMGYTEIPITIIDTDTPDEVIVLKENLERKDLTEEEKANAIYALHIDHGFDISAIVDLTGQSKKFVRNRIVLMDASPKVLKALKQEAIDFPSALVLSQLQTKKAQEETLQWAVDNNADSRFIRTRIAKGQWGHNEQPFTPTKTCSKCVVGQADLFDEDVDAIQDTYCTDLEHLKKEYNLYLGRIRAWAETNKVPFKEHGPVSDYMMPQFSGEPGKFDFDWKEAARIVVYVGDFPFRFTYEPIGEKKTSKGTETRTIEEAKKKITEMQSVDIQRDFVVNRSNRSLKSAVSRAEWVFVWYAFQSMLRPERKREIIKALGCNTEEKLINALRYSTGTALSELRAIIVKEHIAKEYNGGLLAILIKDLFGKTLEDYTLTEDDLKKFRKDELITMAHDIATSNLTESDSLEEIEAKLKGMGKVELVAELVGVTPSEVGMSNLIPALTTTLEEDSDDYFETNVIADAVTAYDALEEA